MGSYCALKFDDLEISSTKSVVPDAFCAIFQETDKVHRVAANPEEDVDEIFYEASRNIVLSRMSLLGCTAAVAERYFEAWLDGERAMWQEWVEDDGHEWAGETLEALKTFNYAEWRVRVANMLRRRFDEASDDQPDDGDVVDKEMRNESEWVWFDGFGSLISLRALLDAFPDVQFVRLDLSDLVAGGWMEQNVEVCSERRRSVAAQAQPFAPTVILAEGSSDIRILQQSLSILFPERVEYFSFFNHSELSVDGGTAYLIKFLKAFAAAKAPFRMVAIFDNDAAGCSALQQAVALGLPRNIALHRLPAAPIATRYPTIGPQGRHTQDVNGLAASIELYLGRFALTRDGDLRPIRWTGYLASANSYQGEVEGKGEVERAFRARLAQVHGPAEARAEFPELVLVWESIFRIAEASAEAAELSLLQ